MELRPEYQLEIINFIARNILPKLDELCLLCALIPVVCIVETWLDVLSCLVDKITITNKDLIICFIIVHAIG